MALTITKRPEKTLTNGYTSRWNSSELPLKYTFSSDLYPVNNVDVANNITASAYNYALKGLELAIGNHSFIVLDSIYVTGTNTSLDGGVFTIKSIPSTTTIVIDYFTTETTVTGSLIKYYNNYNGVVKVYAGARDGHPYNTTGIKPFRFIGEIIASFDTNNEGSIDVRSYIKPDITADFDEINENSRFAWTDFTIEYEESYDKSDGTNVNTFNSGFVQDEQDNCTPFTGFVDPSFDNGLTDWSEADITNWSTSNWVSGVGQITSSLSQGPSLGSATKVLYQNITILAGVPYKFVIDVELTGTFTNPQFRVYDTNSNLLGSLVMVGNGVYELEITTNQDVTDVGISIGPFGATGNTLDVVLKSLQVTTTVLEPCLISTLR